MARLALLFSTLVWGVTFVVVERALDDLPVFHLLAYRFTLGALLLLPWLLRRRGRVESWPALLRDAVPIGVMLFAGYAFQTGGLLSTTPSRSAFLTGLTVLFVPLAGVALGRARPRALSLAGTVAAVVGLWALFQPWGGDAGAAFNSGDALTIGCAASFAVHVLLVERAVRRHPVVPLAVVQFAVVALLSAPALLFDPPHAAQLTTNAVSAVLITGIFATALGFACQLYAQRRLGAVETAVMLTLEPVVAAIFSIAIGREAASTALVVGGLLIVVGMVLADLGSPPPENPGAAAPRS